MEPGDLVRPLVIFGKDAVGVVLDGPKPSNGTFGVENGTIYEVLINGQVCFMFDTELEAFDESR
jgi:hypothetical protein